MTRCGKQWGKDKPLALYCGIDLHSRRWWLAILEEKLRVVKEEKVGGG